MPNLKHPKVQFIVLLSILFLVTMFHLPLTTSLRLLFLCTAGSAGFDLLFAKLLKKDLQIPYSGIITGLILTLIIDPGASWYQVLIIAFCAVAIKTFLRITDRHIFNPAASGLLIGFFLFGLSPAWWGPSFYSIGKLHPANLAIGISVLSLAYVSCFRYRRYFTVASFIISSLLLRILLFSFPVSSALASIINPGSLFFALVMLAEPMTSPVKMERQILYGFFVALANFGLVYAFSNGLFPSISNYPDASIIALLLGNLVFFKFR